MLERPIVVRPIRRRQGLPVEEDLVDDPRTLSPEQARARYRDGLVTPTAGWCAGRTQANLVAVPREQAYDVLLFAQRAISHAPGHMAITDGRDVDLLVP